MKKLYCFDFDGTLTNRDTMFLFLKYYAPSRFYFQFLKHIPLFALLKFKLMTAEKVKLSLVAAVLKGASKTDLETAAESFCEKYFPKIMRSNALDFIQQIDSSKTDCIMVTASLDIWAAPFANRLQMELLATRAEYLDGKLTGRFIGANCNGEEKVHRLQKAVEGKKYDKVLAFGDTSGDKPMLQWATEGHYRFFH